MMYAPIQSKKVGIRRLEEGGTSPDEYQRSVEQQLHVSVDAAGGSLRAAVLDVNGFELELSLFEFTSQQPYRLPLIVAFHQGHEFRNVYLTVLDQREWDECLPYWGDLLADKEGPLCGKCHAPGGGGMKKAHGGYPVAACTGCHDPHASDAVKLLRASVHEPMTGGGCSNCHADPKSMKPFAVQEQGAKLCANCHDSAKLAAGGTVQHAPFKKGECLGCHDPHASDGAKLARVPGNGLCLKCHDIYAIRMSVPHPVVATKGCTGCHRPHASDQKSLLAAEPKAVTRI